MSFVNNLIEGLSQGFSRFFDHFPTHLLEGFWDWLFSGLGSVGVKLPVDLSPMSLVTFCLQLMGITWPRIREILVKHIGEENTALIERAWEIISTLIELGPEGIVAMIKEKLDPKTILDQILKAAIDYMVEAIVESVAKRLLLLFNPAGAILQAIELIYRIGKWIFQNAAKIFRLVETVVNGIVDIIAGNVAGFAKAVENALASLVPVVIDFIADYFGLGDLPIKVADLIKQLQEFVLKIIDEIIGTLVEKAKELLASIFGKDEKDKDKKGPVDEELGRDVGFTAAGEHHHQWIALSGEDAVPMVASAARTVDEQLAEWEQQAPTKFKDQPERLTEAQSLIGTARSQLATLETDADALAGAFAQAKAEPSEKPPSDAAVEGEQVTLTQALTKLYELFEQVPDPRILFAEQLGLMPASARELVISVLMTLKPPPTAWEEATAAAKKAAVVKVLLNAPLNLSHDFGAWAHQWAAEATKAGVDRALAEYGGAVASDSALARNIKSIRRQLRDRLAQGMITPAGASDLLSDYKPRINVDAEPFQNVRPSVRLTFWTATEQDRAVMQITLAFSERVRRGTGQPASLPTDVRTHVIQRLAGQPLEVKKGLHAVRIAFTTEIEAEIMNYLDSEAKLDDYDQEAQAELRWWHDNLFQEEFHHAWPKWLGAPQDQTVIIIPRALHNFSSLRGQEFPGGFHQIFNRLFEDAFSDVPLKADDWAGWRDYVKGDPGAMDLVEARLEEAYVLLFQGFTGAAEEAKGVFLKALATTFSLPS